MNHASHDSCFHVVLALCLGVGERVSAGLRKERDTRDHGRNDLSLLILLFEPWNGATEGSSDTSIDRFGLFDNSMLRDVTNLSGKEYFQRSISFAISL